MTFYHPKYYKELRKRNKEEARAQLKVPSPDLDQAISEEATDVFDTSVRPDPGLKPQAASVKPQAPEASSDKRQAPSSKRQA